MQDTVLVTVAQRCAKARQALAEQSLGLVQPSTLLEWGSANENGHRAAFCIPMIVPTAIAYNIFECQTPDLQAKGVPLGTDYKGREVHGSRDVWVVRVAAREAVTVLQLRLAQLRKRHGNFLICMDELGRRLHCRGRYEEAEPLCRESFNLRRAQLGEEHTTVLSCSATWVSWRRRKSFTAKACRGAAPPWATRRLPR
ncbi:unnamed protein product [Effrenium voratum]|uniref:Uncharacterized protein n=1 Tax=Effrenium voratum TaxID=2562239 RepID=A0AA36J2K2_9DINO|nr:unnamed protein product [Effrenium voratum]